MPNENRKIRLIEFFRYGIFLFLLFLPLVWFRNGIIDLGGDSSRVYYADPSSYLVNFSMSSILNIGNIVDFPGYYGVPFTFLLIVINKIFSPSTVNALLTGMNLSVGFLFTTLVVNELLGIVTSKKDSAVRLASISSGLLYVFFQYQTKSWTTPLMTQFAFFLNPAFVLFILRYLITGNFLFLGVFSIISFIFAQNFSFAGAPYFFSFYPITAIFLFFFARGRFVLGRLWGLFVFIIVMLLLHGFHWFSLIQNLFYSDSTLNTMVFDVKNIKERGLSYFFASASSTYLPHSLLGASQFNSIPHSAYLFIIYPIIVFLGGFFVWRLSYKKSFLRFYIELLFLFGALLLLVTGHILPIFQKVYSYLFYIPGFTMFRAFYDKWAYPYYFYYSILIGVSFFILYKYTGPVLRRLLVTALIIPILLSAPFIQGKTVITPMFGSKNFHSGVKFESSFTQSLDYIRDIGKSDRWLNLPFADWEYQVVRDNNNGIYIAPSIISLLRGKTDYVGLVQFEPYKRILLSALKTGNYKMLNSLLRMLSVRYTYFNNDQSILASYAGNFPYNEIGSSFPQDTNKYKGILRELYAESLSSFGTYEIFRLNNEAFPRVFVPDCIIRSESSDVILPFETPLCDGTSYPAVVNSSDVSLPSSAVMRVFSPDDDYRYTAKNVVNPDIQYSFAKFKPNSFIYPLIRLKEDADIWLLSLLNRPDEVRLKRYAFASKRIYELDRWRSGIPPQEVVRCSWFRIYCHYTKISWVDILNSYSSLITENLSTETKQQRNIIHDEAFAYISRDRDRVMSFIRSSGFNDETQKKLFDYSAGVFTGLMKSITGGVEKSDNVFRYKGLSLNEIANNYFIEGDNEFPIWNPISSDRIRGQDQYEYINSEENLLADSEAALPEFVASAAGVLSFRHTPGNAMTWIVMKNIRPDRYYKISVEYMTEGQPYDIVISHYNPLLPEARRRNTIYRQSLFSSIRTNADILFKTDKNAVGVEISIVPADWTKSGKISLKKLVLTGLPLPRLLETRGSQKGADSPTLTFVKVNPTKYKVDIKNVKEPFYLVLNDSYSDHWKIFRSERPSLGYLLGVERLFEAAYGFIDPKPLEFLYNTRLNPQHVKVNYFANGWLVDPAMLRDGSGTLVIEHQVQGNFYITFIMSLFVLFIIAVSVIIYAIVSVYRIIKSSMKV